MEKSDMMYYTAYILLLILLGVWLLVWAVGIIALDEMFLFWLFSAGLLMIVFGTVRTKEAPRGSTLLIGAGMLLSILMLMFLAIITDLIGGWVGAAIGIILIGIAGLIILLLSLRR
jgi:hypothetical protein